MTPQEIYAAGYAVPVYDIQPVSLDAQGNPTYSHWKFRYRNEEVRSGQIVKLYDIGEKFKVAKIDELRDAHD